MKSYQSASISYKTDSSKISQHLQPIMQYSYQLSATKNNINNSNNTKYKTSYITQFPIQNNKHKQIKTLNINNNQNHTKIINTLKPTNTKVKQSHSQTQIHNYSSKQNDSQNSIGYSAKTDSKNKNKQSPNKQIATNIIKPRSTVLSQHNPQYSQQLFPSNQSIKQKLIQNVQQQMLNNYYINKYSTLMSKISNDKIKIQQLIQNDKQMQIRNKQRQQMSQNKKRKNFKQIIMKKKQSQKQSVNIIPNQSISKRDINFSQQNDSIYQQYQANINQFSQNNKQRQNKYKHQNIYQLNQNKQKNQNKYQLSQNKQRNQFLAVTFSPSKRPNLHFDNNVQSNKSNKSNKSNSISKSVNKRHSQHKISNQQDIISKVRRQLYNQKPLLPNQQTLKQQQQYKYTPSQNIQYNQISQQNNSQQNLSQLSNKPYHSRQISPSRQNFKQSLKQKKSLYVEYQQNYDLYKQLQSSIINQLYSPSPKKIQQNKWHQIQFTNTQINKDQKYNLQNYQLGNFKQKQPFANLNNIQINDDQVYFTNLQNHINNQHSNLINNQTNNKQIQILRQSIRKSINQNRSSNSSPNIFNKYSPQARSSPSRITPLQSPKRLLILDQYKDLNYQQKQKQNNWNPHFSTDNSHNRKLILGQSITKRVHLIDSKSSPQSIQKKYHSLQKNTPIKNKTLQKIKQVSSKSKSQNKHKNSSNHFIKEEDQPESDLENHKKQNQQNFESYNQVAKKLGNSFDINQDIKNHVSFKSPRRNSFHSQKFNSKQPQSRLIQQMFKNSNNSNQSVKDPYDQQDIQFIPAATQGFFDDKSFQQNLKSQKQSHARKNLIQTVEHTRSRKPSDQISFISDSNNSFHEMSMLSRFSMTSQQGSMIIKKLQNEITQNEFGPYQHALQSLRQLLYENKTAWPIYVVGQKILDDRTQYEKKIQVQGKILEDYKQKIIRMKQLDSIQQTSESNIILKNQLHIMRLIRQLAQSD